MPAAHSTAAADKATGKPRAASSSNASPKGVVAGAGWSAGAMLTASATPRAARLCAGKALSPKAGTRVNAGVTRAHESAQPRKSTINPASAWGRI